MQGKPQLSSPKYPEVIKNQRKDYEKVNLKSQFKGKQISKKAFFPVCVLIVQLLKSISQKM